MASSFDQTIDLKSYTRVLCLRKGIFILCSVAVICTAAIAITLMPEVYESSVVLAAEDRQPLARELEALIGGRQSQQGSYRGDQRYLARLQATVRSRPFLERVVRRLQMQDDPVVRAQAAERARDHPDIGVDELAMRMLVNRLRSRVHIGSRGNGTHRITVTEYSGRNAQLLAHSIGEMLRETTKQSAVEQMRSAQDFGMEQLRIYDEGYKKAEQALEEYRSSVIEENLKVSLVNSLNLSASEILQRRVQNDAALAQNRFAQDDNTRTEKDAATILLNDSDALEIDRRLRVILKGAISDRLTNPSAEAGDWPPNGTYVTTRRDLLHHLEQRAADKFPSFASERVGAIAAHAFYRMDAQIKSDASLYLSEAIADWKRRVQAQPMQERELERLQHEVTMYRELLESFRAQKVAADLNQAVELTSLGGHVTILSPAQLPLGPSAPNKMKLLLGAMLMGPLFGAALAVVTESLDPTIRSLDEFRKIVPEPILGTTPLLSKLRSRQRGIRRYWVPAAVTSILVLTGAFFVARSTVLRDIASIGRPVQVVNPEEVKSQ